MGSTTEYNMILQVNHKLGLERVHMRKYYKNYDSMKSDNQKNECKISEVKIRGIKTVEMPMWMINNYIKSTCDNYTKLVYILKILDIFSGEESDIVDIGISTTSVPIDKDGRDFEERLISYVRDSEVGKNKEKYCLMSHTPEKGEKGFWHYFSSCERPICFAITNDNEVILLYNPRGDEGIRVSDISYHSPIDMGWGGIGECIEHLVNAGTQIKNDRRLQAEHEARMVTQSMQTMSEGINVQIKLQNATLPESQKLYLQNMYEGLMAKQEKLNEQIGICRPGIDTRV